MKRALLFGAMFLVSSQSLSNDVYLVAKVKITGTTYTQVALLQDKEVTTFEACEKERIFGRRGNWRRYSHFVRKNTGLSLNAQYFCVTSKQKIQPWFYRNEYEHVHLINLENNQFTITATPSYLSCLEKLRETHKDETREYFCAKSNQTVQ